MIIEIWKPVPGLEPYEASSLGRVRRPAWIQMKVVTVGCAPRAHRKPESVLVGEICSGGYRRIFLFMNGVKCRHLAHRMVAMAFHGPCPKGMICRHLSGTRTDNRPQNLAWGSYSQNQLDRHSHGTAITGAAHHRTKLNEKQAEEIRAHITGGSLTQKAIGAIYGVTGGAVSAIKRGDTWRHIGHEPD